MCYEITVTLADHPVIVSETADPTGGCLGLFDPFSGAIECVEVDCDGTCHAEGPVDHGDGTVTWKCCCGGLAD